PSEGWGGADLTHPAFFQDLRGFSSFSRAADPDRLYITLVLGLERFANGLQTDRRLRFDTSPKRQRVDPRGRPSTRSLALRVGAVKGLRVPVGARPTPGRRLYPRKQSESIGR